ncbi:MAG: hypothetical protein IJN63_04080 [Clostridia bacterium]|nr:hypothetical protein [Clostridia bacterium]
MKKVLLGLLVLNVMLATLGCSWSVGDADVPEDIKTFSNDADFYAKLEESNNIVYKASSRMMTHESLSVGKGVFHFKTFQRWQMLYNPLMDEVHYLCFDPSCDHGFQKCIANKLNATNVFVYYDGDLYCAYLEVILSQDVHSGLARISGDGASMEVLYKQNFGLIRSMKAGNGYIYISTSDGLYRYEIATGEMKKYSGVEAILNGFVVTDRGLILHSSGDPYVNLTDYDLGNKRPLFKRGGFLYADGMIYYARRNYAEDGKTKTDLDFREYNMDTGEDRLICKQPDYLKLLCVADGYFYYAPKKYTDNGYNSKASDRILRIDIKTGKVDEVYYSEDVYIKEMYCINGEYYACVIIEGQFDMGISPAIIGASDVYGRLVFSEKQDAFEFDAFDIDYSEFPLLKNYLYQ